MFKILYQTNNNSLYFKLDVALALAYDLVKGLDSSGIGSAPPADLYRTRLLFLTGVRVQVNYP